MSLTFDVIATVETEVVSQNITHNLAPMWQAAGVYDALYESDGKKAKDVIPVLEKGLAEMKARPNFFKTLDSSNGWGTYKNAVPWLERLIEEMKKYPDGKVEISR